MLEFEPGRLNEALELYCQRPTYENASALRNQLAGWMFTRDAAVVGPFLAVTEVLRARRQIPVWRLPLLVLAQQMLRRKFAPARAGWNDYYMTLWKLTKTDEAANEIHRRAKHVGYARHLEQLSDSSDEWDYVGASAAWMVSSVREQDNEFDAAMRVAEEKCVLCIRELLGVNR